MKDTISCVKYRVFRINSGLLDGEFNNSFIKPDFVNKQFDSLEEAAGAVREEGWSGRNLIILPVASWKSVE